MGKTHGPHSFHHITIIQIYTYEYIIISFFFFFLINLKIKIIFLKYMRNVHLKIVNLTEYALKREKQLNMQNMLRKNY